MFVDFDPSNREHFRLPLYQIKRAVHDGRVVVKLVPVGSEHYALAAEAPWYYVVRVSSASEASTSTSSR